MPSGHNAAKAGLLQDEAALDIEDAVHGALESAGFIHYGNIGFCKTWYAVPP